MEFKSDVLGLALLGSISAFSIWSAANPSVFTISQFTTEKSKENARLGMNIGLGLCGALSAGLYLAYGKKGTLPAVLTGATGIGLYGLYEYMLSTSHKSNPTKMTMAQQAEAMQAGRDGAPGGPHGGGGGGGGGEASSSIGDVWAHAIGGGGGGGSEGLPGQPGLVEAYVPNGQSFPGGGGGFQPGSYFFQGKGGGGGGQQGGDSHGIGDWVPAIMDEQGNIVSQTDGSILLRAGPPGKPGRGGGGGGGSIGGGGGDPNDPSTWGPRGAEPGEEIGGTEQHPGGGGFQPAGGFYMSKAQVQQSGWPECSQCLTHGRTLKDCSLMGACRGPWSDGATIYDAKQKQLKLSGYSNEDYESVYG